MGEDARARDAALANLRLEVSALAERMGTSTLPQATAALSASLASFRRTVLWAAVMVSTTLVVCSSIRACSARDVTDLRLRVERLERQTPGVESP